MVFVEALLSSPSIVFAFLARFGARRSVVRFDSISIGVSMHAARGELGRRACSTCLARTSANLTLAARRGNDISLVLIRGRETKKRK